MLLLGFSSLLHNPLFSFVSVCDGCHDPVSSDPGLPYSHQVLQMVHNSQHDSILILFLGFSCLLQNHNFPLFLESFFSTSYCYIFYWLLILLCILSLNFFISRHFELKQEKDNISVLVQEQASWFRITNRWCFPRNIDEYWKHKKPLDLYI